MGTSVRHFLLAMSVMFAGGSAHRLPRSIGSYSPPAPSGPGVGVTHLPLPQFPPGPLPQIIGVGAPQEPQVVTLPQLPQTLLRTKVLPHHIPPKTIRIVNTVVVPYPVPHHVRHEVAVPIAKPYPVPVPVHVPSHDHSTHAHYKQSEHADITKAVFKGNEESDTSSFAGGSGYGGGDAGASHGFEGGPSGVSSGEDDRSSEGSNFSGFSGGYEDAGAFLVPPASASSGEDSGDDYSQGSPNAISAIDNAFHTNGEGGGSQGNEKNGAYNDIGATTAGEAYTNYANQRGPGGQRDHYGSSSQSQQTVSPEDGNGNSGEHDGDRFRENLKKRSQHHGSPHSHLKTIVTIEKAVDAGHFVHTSYSGANRIHKK